MYCNACGKDLTEDKCYVANGKYSTDNIYTLCVDCKDRLEKEGVINNISKYDESFKDKLSYPNSKEQDNVDYEFIVFSENIDKEYKALDILMSKHSIEDIIPRVYDTLPMHTVRKYTAQEIENMVNDLKIDCVEEILRSNLKRTVYTYGWEQDAKVKRFIKGDKYKNTSKRRVLWNKLHGKNRKDIKFLIKQHLRLLNKNVMLHDKYAGNKNVFVVVAKVGLGNWFYSQSELDTILNNQPWYIDRVSQYYDQAYSEIYITLPDEDVAEYYDMIK